MIQYIYTEPKSVIISMLMDKEALLRIGKNDIWIKNARDPIFDEDSIEELETLEELEQMIDSQYWCIGQTFVYKTIAFLCQAGGDPNHYDSWKVAKTEDGVTHSFETLTLSLILKRGQFKNYVETYLKTSLEDLLTGNYEIPNDRSSGMRVTSEKQLRNALFG